MVKVLTKITFLFLFVVLFPLKVDAYYCDYALSAKLKKIASNINTSYDYVIENDSATFSITINNVYKDLILKDVNNNKMYYPDQTKDMTEFVITGLKDGTAYTFELYTNAQYCEDKIMHSLYINTPKYNPYYKLDICKGYEDYQLCQRWTNHGLNKENFEKEMNSYIESLKKEEPKEEKPNHEEMDTWLLDFYFKYYYYILPTIVIVCLVVIFKNMKKDTFKF